MIMYKHKKKKMACMMRLMDGNSQADILIFASYNVWMLYMDLGEFDEISRKNSS